MICEHILSSFSVSSATWRNPQYLKKIFYPNLTGAKFRSVYSFIP
jgi:hypothetical protein